MLLPYSYIYIPTLSEQDLCAWCEIRYYWVYAIRTYFPPFEFSYFGVILIVKGGLRTLKSPQLCILLLSHIQWPNVLTFDTFVYIRRKAAYEKRKKEEEDAQKKKASLMDKFGGKATSVGPIGPKKTVAGGSTRMMVQNPATIKAKLLEWSQRCARGYPVSWEFKPESIVAVWLR